MASGPSDDPVQERDHRHAGNASWVTDVPALADALRRSGVDGADGFAPNVSNYETTEASVEYGLELSRELEQGAPEGTPAPHFVVDTSATAPVRRRTSATARVAGATRRTGR